MTLLAIEAALVPAGWLLMDLGTSATPASGTDGPFADGAAGAIVLAGFVYTYGGGLIIAAVTWIYLRGRFGSS
jgi:hypothetical protein